MPKVDHFYFRSDDTRRFRLSRCLLATSCRVCNGVINKGELRISPEIGNCRIG